MKKSKGYQIVALYSKFTRLLSGISEHKLTNAILVRFLCCKYPSSVIFSLIKRFPSGN